MGVFAELMDEIRQAINENKEYLTELDGAIGDADHGINMARGFDAVMKKLETDPDISISEGLKKVGMTLISTVGGASGPLYGTAFLRASAPAQGKTEITRELAAQMLASAIQGIKERGKAVLGDKTMIDALEPAYSAFIQAMEDGKNLLECLEKARDEAYKGVEHTKTIIARKGRASYLGERSLGHQDPGATSSWIILNTITEFCRKTA